MIGHVSRVGELVLEKAHQMLKRAIRQGNSKDIQLSSMNSAIFSDWEGRLHSQIAGAISGSPQDTLGCFCLFSGREAVAVKNGKLTEKDAFQVRQVIGPDSCIPVVLATCNRSVHSARADNDFLHELSWHLTGNLQTISESGRTSACSRVRALAIFKHAKRFQGSPQSHLFGDELRVLAKNGIPALSLRVGDIVELVCYYPNELHFHSPFIMHRCNTTHMAKAPEGAKLWALMALFRGAGCEHRNEIWAALRPCSPIPGARASKGFNRYNSPHFVSDTICFAQVKSNMHPVGVLHFCNSFCNPTLQGNRIKHFPPSILDEGAIFFPIRRNNGYPPRQG